MTKEKNIFMIRGMLSAYSKSGTFAFRISKLKELKHLGPWKLTENFLKESK